MSMEVRLGGNIDDYKRKMKEAKSEAEQLGNAFKTVGGAVSAYFGFEAIKSGIETVVSSLAEMQHAAERLNMGNQVEEFQKYAYAIRQSGSTLEVLEKGVNKMQQALGKAFDGDKAESNKINEWGLSIKALQAMSPDKQFEAVAKAIVSTQDPAIRSERLMQAFGRSGEKMLPMLQNLASLKQEAVDVGAVLKSELVESASKLEEQFKSLQASLIGVVAETGFIKWLTDVNEGIRAMLIGLDKIAVSKGVITKEQAVKDIDNEVENEYKTNPEFKKKIDEDAAKKTSKRNSARGYITDNEKQADVLIAKQDEKKRRLEAQNWKEGETERTKPIDKKDVDKANMDKAYDKYDAWLNELDAQDEKDKRTNAEPLKKADELIEKLKEQNEEQDLINHGFDEQAKRQKILNELAEKYPVKRGKDGKLLNKDEDGNFITKDKAGNSLIDAEKTIGEKKVKEVDSAIAEAKRIDIEKRNIEAFKSIGDDAYKLKESIDKKAGQFNSYEYKKHEIEEKTGTKLTKEQDEDLHKVTNAQDRFDYKNELAKYKVKDAGTYSNSMAQIGSTLNSVAVSTPDNSLIKITQQNRDLTKTLVDLVAKIEPKVIAPGVKLNK